MCAKSLECDSFRDSFRDHCHITGEYRCPAYNACNLKLRLRPKTTTIPVVFHNLRGYDSHLLTQVISNVEGRITCIPKKTEKYISFSLGQPRFVDNAGGGNQAWGLLTNWPVRPSSERRELLMRKGVFPHEYMDSLEHFVEPKLPPKEAFFSKLSDQHINEDDYAVLDFRVLQPGGLPRPLQSHRLTPPSRRFRDLTEDLHATVRSRSPTGMPCSSRLVRSPSY